MSLPFNWLPAGAWNRDIADDHKPREALLTSLYVHTYYVDMNITLSVDRQLVERARKVAESMGKSLNQIIRDHLAYLQPAATARPPPDGIHPL